MIKGNRANSKTKLSEKRFYHSQCVMERAKELAKKFGYDIEIAEKVGIAHDIAKEIPNEEKLKYVKENNIKIDEIERENPTLLHAKNRRRYSNKRTRIYRRNGTSNTCTYNRNTKYDIAR